MKMTIDANDFVNQFTVYNRADNFTSQALYALFDHLEELEQDIGEEIELDVISICCEYSEYCFSNARGDWSHLLDLDDWDDNDELLEALRDHTTVIEVDDETYVIQDF
jgi:hypothetical protein